MDALYLAFFWLLAGVLNGIASFLGNQTEPQTTTTPPTTKNFQHPWMFMAGYGSHAS